MAPPPRRAAPYASARSLREFLQRIQGLGVPARVDREYLRRLSVARNNEWSLLSALKFIGVLTPQGAPTQNYRFLQTTDRRQPTLAGLVTSAYGDLITAGGLTMDQEDLRNYFRLASSASQAKNAARFFREVAEMSGLREEVEISPFPELFPSATTPSNVLELPSFGRRQTSDPPLGGEVPWQASPESTSASADEAAAAGRPSGILEFDPFVRVRVSLVEKMPAARPDWSSEEYAQACDRFVAMCDRVESLLHRLED
jgi:Family of unknown function (DUF5343)